MDDLVANMVPDPMQFETAQLRKFADFCPDLFCVARTDSSIERVNPAFLATLGYSCEEIASMSLFERRSFSLRRRLCGRLVFDQSM
jgi:PAS domain S-box-containing protein